MTMFLINKFHVKETIIMYPKIMKAAVVRKVHQLSIEEIPVPELTEYSVLCKNLYGATCTATDQHIIDQTIPFPVELPTLLGHETIGRVVAVGRKTRYIKEGERIARTMLHSTKKMNAHWGGFAEYGLAYDYMAMKEDGISEKEYRNYIKNQTIPEDIDSRVAPLLITWRETHSYISRMGLRSGQTVLIIGSGGNGLSFMNHASVAGARVIGIGSLARTTQAKLCGADKYLSYKDTNLSGQLKSLAQDGFDLIIDAIGNNAQCELTLPHIAKNGVFGIYGIDGGNIFSLNPLTPGHSFRFYNDGYLEGETHMQVIDGIRKKLYKSEAYIDVNHPYLLENINEAFAMLKKKEWPKALIKLGDE